MVPLASSVQVIRPSVTTMSDEAIAGPLHVTVEADVRVTDSRRLGAGGPAQLAEVLAGLIRRHAWEAGLEIVDPESVRVVVRPTS